MQSKQVNILVLTPNAALRNVLLSIFKDNKSFCVFADDSYYTEGRFYKWHTIDILIIEINIKDKDNLQHVESIQGNHPYLLILAIDSYNSTEFHLNVNLSSKPFYLPVNSTIEEIPRVIISIIKENFSLQKLVNPRQTEAIRIVPLSDLL